MLCALHATRLRDLLAAKPFSISWLSASVSTQGVKLFLLSHRASAEVVKDLLRLARGAESKKRIWVFDFEGLVITRSGVAPVHTEVGAVNFADPAHVRYSGFLKYALTAAAMTREIKQQGAIRFKNGTFNTPYVQNFLSNMFEDGFGKGNCLWEHREALLHLGFGEEEDVVIHWSRHRVDCTGVGRIMRNETGVVTPISDVYTKSRTIDPLKIWKACTSYEGPCSLSVVYRIMFPGEDTAFGLKMDWHTAEWDTLATCRLFIKLVQGLSDVDV
ncbi:hypothetical protein HBI48_083060 [Parastagonospora nodorum]|nr:hypothetical protein HBI48_083060 [Parastagonospora nodorum]